MSRLPAIKAKNIYVHNVLFRILTKISVPWSVDDRPTIGNGRAPVGQRSVDGLLTVGKGREQVGQRSVNDWQLSGTSRPTVGGRSVNGW